jgi:hypothetical protein
MTKTAAEATMNLEEAINQELLRLHLLPLNDEQVKCLSDPDVLEDAAGMLEDLRDRCGVRLPLVWGQNVGGPFKDLEEAEERAVELAPLHPVLVLDEMATDESRSYGGNEYYLNAFDGAEAAMALADRGRWEAVWIRGQRQQED